MAKTLVYQIYLPSWLEYGGLSAVTKHLERIKNLEVDVVWLSAALTSPWADHGYDVSDHYQIDPRFGSMAEFDEFVQAAHRAGIQVILDLIPNHTSIKHEWFRFRPRFYCWSKEDRPGWHNLFDDGPAWQYYEEDGEFYLHLFHRAQADLNWYPKGYDKEINQELVRAFHQIIDFWTLEHDVDGFRIDFPQALNKDFGISELHFEELLFGDYALGVLNALFGGGSKDLFLMMECFDPTMGVLIKYYLDNTPVNFVLNVMTKDEIKNGEQYFIDLIRKQALVPGYMIELESHDSVRFPSRKFGTPEGSIWGMFSSGAEGVCLYQGQELGLENPTKDNLPNHLMLELDAMTKMRYEQGEDLDLIRPSSRANARVPLPLREYDRQEKFPSSYLNLTKKWIKRWKEQ